MLGNKPGSQSALQFITKTFDGVEVSSLNRLVMFFHVKRGQQFLQTNSTGPKGPEKQPQTIIPPTPNFTVGTTLAGRYYSPVICQTQIQPCSRECTSTAPESSPKTKPKVNSGMQI